MRHIASPFRGSLRLALGLAIAGGATAAEVAVDFQVVAELAQARSPGREARRFDALAAAAAAEGAQAVWRPRLTAAAGWSRRDQDTTVDLGPFLGRVVLEDRDRLDGAVEVVQPVWTSGRGAAAEQAGSAGVLAAGAEERRFDRDLAWNARQRLADLILAESAAMLYRSRVDERTAEHADAEARHRAGRIESVEVRLAATRLEQARQQSAEQQRAIALARRRLAMLIDAEPGDLRPADGLDQLAARGGQVLAAARDAVGSGSETDAARAALLASSAEERRWLAESLPQAEAFARATSEGSDLHGRDEGWTVGLRLTWSLWDGGRTAAERSAARDRQRSAMRRLADIRRDRTAAATELALRLDQATARVTEAEALRAAAEPAYAEARRLSRDLGLVPLSDLAGAGDLVLDARLGHLHARVERARIVIDLLRLAEP